MQRLVIPWREIGLIQTLICFKKIPSGTTVDVLVQGRSSQASFDKDGCLCFEGNQILPGTKPEVFEWATGVWAGLIPLVPDMELWWCTEDQYWADFKESDCLEDPEGVMPKLEIPGLINLAPLVAATMTLSKTPMLLISTSMKKEDCLDHVQISC